MSNIILYTRPNCPFCQAFKTELDKLGVSYTAERRHNDFVPQLLVNGEVIFKGLPKKQKLHDYFTSQ